MAGAVIEIEQLQKAFDGQAVLRGVDLRLDPGQVYGILGPNGAGKSTLIHLTLGFLNPTSGTVRLFGSSDLDRMRSRVGYLPERSRYHMRFTAREYLRFLGRFDDMAKARLETRVNEELHRVGLTDVADRPLLNYSKGMLQRLGIAQALLGEPELLVADEPTSGLDPVGQRELLDLLAKLRDDGLSILMATHVLEEAEQVCDTVGILNGGRIAYQTDIASLRLPGRSALITVTALPPAVAVRIEALAPAVRCSSNQIALQPNSSFLQAQVLRILLESDVALISLEPQGRPLEDLYLRVVRGEPVEALTRAIPVEADEPAPSPPRQLGDTLLRELLLQDEERHEDEP